MMFACLTGGECLTYPGFQDLYLYLRSLGVHVCVYTNGSMLDKNWLQFFIKHKPAKIQITLYGGDEDTYERVTGHRMFDRVIETIRRLKAADLPLKVAVTPSKYMGEGVFEAIRILRSLDVPYDVNTMLFDPKEETGRSGLVHDLETEDYARILCFINELSGNEIRKIDPALLPPPGGSFHENGRFGMPCGAGRSSFTLEWDGNMVPCSSIRHIQAKPLEVGFQAAWDFVRQLCSQWPQVPECMDCPYKSVCTKCPALKARFAEPGKQPFALCERTRYLVQCGVVSIPDCE